jgi:hypothetical protein
MGRGTVMAKTTVIDRDTEQTPTRERRRDGQGHGGNGRNGPLERITVNLIARASRALQAVSERTGDSKTDSINRAIQVYDYVTEIDSSGGGIYVRQSADSELQLLKMF